MSVSTVIYSIAVSSPHGRVVVATRSQKWQLGLVVDVTLIMNDSGGYQREVDERCK